MILEIAIVLLLTMFNGLLAMSELAIVSARPARLKVMAEQGNRGAQIALELGAEPGRFLSSVQIGITMVGVLSGAFSGATLGNRVAAALIDAGMSATMAQTLAVGGVVVVITYLSLIIGELVPKQIALRSPEGVAARVAPIILWISRIAAPIVWVLDKSGKAVLRLLGQSGETDRSITDEEIKVVISEARLAGVIEDAERDMIAGVMRIADRTARGLMTPRHEVETVDVGASLSAVAEDFKKFDRSRLLVRDGSDDEIIGILTSQDLLGHTDEDTPDLRDLVQPVPVIREGLPALNVIEQLKTTPSRMLLVFDEYGHFEGVVTSMDVLEAIAGDFPEPGDDEPKAVTREDGSMLVAGWMPADEFADMIGLNLPEDRGYESVAGLVLEHAGILPELGSVFTIGNWRVEVVDMDGRRIDKILISREAEPASE
ncbi:hemolysin family protein [Paracoccus fistulariae]|uniref:HlyC/CorC family transporter n=1 Tax=Paracoccus fistulariae TaxID=658446 RepID=A0ABY7SP02_9RHOB|nr:hemolysin family protein [Paracoccus fistulariae]MDB6182287.1 hemolysin family protein [Paracoccus fistulariae]WCR08729.1 HlyC/CorC family transporter [Paracoccus fistulariae]